jgi:transcriptional regulator NrdR family protein
MHCPKCQRQTRVVDSRRVEGTTVRKRRCECGHVYQTYEVLEDEAFERSVARLEKSFKQATEEFQQNVAMLQQQLQQRLKHLETEMCTISDAVIGDRRN